MRHLLLFFTVLLFAFVVSAHANDHPLFTGDAVQSVTVDASSSSSSSSPSTTTVDPTALQLILSRALHDEQPDAMYVLAMLRFYGQHVDRDVAGAVRLLRRLATDYGHRDAQFTMGVLAIRGVDSLPRDDRRGAAWFATSAAQGHADAKWVLATLYNTGRGVAQDAARAFELLTDTVSHDDANPRAVFQLGVMYEYGRGGAQQDPARAAQLYLVASERGVVDATYYLGLLYATGRGVPKNSIHARQLLTRAAGAGHAGALLRLGEMHTDGMNGVTIDYAAALHFFQRAMHAATTADEPHVETLARQRAEELEWVLTQAETLVREQEQALGVPLLRVQVATIEQR